MSQQLTSSTPPKHHEDLPIVASAGPASSSSYVPSGYIGAIPLFRVSRSSWNADSFRVPYPLTLGSQFTLLPTGVYTATASEGLTTRAIVST